MATIAFTIGAPAKTIDMTTAGDPFAPKASRTPNAPTAPTIPAASDHTTPRTGIAHEAPSATMIATGARIPIRK